MVPRAREYSISFVAIMILSCFSASLLIEPDPSSNTSHRAKITAYLPHNPIAISDNSGFLGPNDTTGISWGSGTISDPYIIRGWDIDQHGFSIGSAISIGYSDVFFRIEDCYLHNATNGNGISLGSASNGALVNNVCSGNLIGIMLASPGGPGPVYCTNNLIANNTCQNNGMHGIYLYDACTGNVIFNNNCSNNNYDGIYINDGGSRNLVFNNRLMSNRLYGVFTGSLYQQDNRIWNNTF